MPIEVTKTRDGTVAVAHCFGKLTGVDVSDSINFAFGSRRIEPSLDRIVTISPDAELYELDIEALRSIQQCILDQELRDGRAARFRSVLVHSSPEQETLMKLYKAIWDALDVPGAEFFVVASEDEAWRTLGLVPLPIQ